MPAEYNSLCTKGEGSTMITVTFFGLSAYNGTGHMGGISGRVLVGDSSATGFAVRYMGESG